MEMRDSIPYRPCVMLVHVVYDMYMIYEIIAFEKLLFHPSTRNREAGVSKESQSPAGKVLMPENSARVNGTTKIC